jgi:hypothetical protein
MANEKKRLSQREFEITRPHESWELIDEELFSFQDILSEDDFSILIGLPDDALVNDTIKRSVEEWIKAQTEINSIVRGCDSDELINIENLISLNAQISDEINKMIIDDL